MKKSELEAINNFTILVDTREQHPYKYPNTRVECLPYGDYTVEVNGRSYIDKIVIERKGAISELFAFSGSQRDRFVRELERMKDVKYKYLLVEADYMTIANNRSPGVLPIQTVYATIWSFAVKYGIAPLFLNSYQNGRGAMYKIMQFFVKYEILNIGEKA